MKIAILHNRIGKNAHKDELDILAQADAVTRALEELEHDVTKLDFSLNLYEMTMSLQMLKPDLVFNLADSLQGEGRLIHFATSILDQLNLPYTGCKTEALFLTSNKLVAKRLMRLRGIPTPEWMSLESPDESLATLNEPFLLKSIWEHASVGMDTDSLVTVQEKEELRTVLKQKNGDFFAERYIEGREFNLSLLGGEEKIEVLSPAEMKFFDYPKDRPKILGYDAKWNEESSEYHSTRRSFEFHEKDRSLLETLKDLALKCWKCFDLNGYARVDFRVDERDNPYVLEINANPCIAPDSGFVMAAKQSSISYTRMVECIVDHPVPHGAFRQVKKKMVL